MRTPVVTRAKILAMTLLDRLEKAIEHAIETGRADSERALSKRAGLSPGYLGRTKSGMRSNPSYDPGSKTLAQIARACGVRVEWLSAEQGTMLEDFPGGSLVTPAGYGEILKEPVTEFAAGSHNLEAVLEQVVWPDEVDVPTMVELVKTVRKDAFASGGEDLPQSFWRQRVRRVLAELTGKAKDVPPLIFEEPRALLDRDELLQEQDRQKAALAARRKVKKAR